MKALCGTGLIASLMLMACAQSAPLPATSGIAPQERTVFVTRHMQKADGSDPDLNADGKVAAERLADALASKGVTAIFATPTRRAMQTAAPLSSRTGVPITSYDPRDPQALAEKVASHAGSALIVGHSNTVHDLIDRLGGTPPAPLSEQDYGRIFVIGQTGTVSEFRVS